MAEASAKGLLLYTEDGGCTLSAGAVLCVRRWFDIELAVVAESRNQSGAPSIWSMRDAKGSRATIGAAVGCGGLGLLGCSSIVSGFDIRRILGVCGVGSAKGSLAM